MMSGYFQEIQFYGLGGNKDSRKMAYILAVIMIQYSLHSIYQMQHLIVFIINYKCLLAFSNDREPCLDNVM